MAHENDLSFLLARADEMAQTIVTTRRRGLQVTRKSGGTLVTTADLEAERVPLTDPVVVYGAGEDREAHDLAGTRLRVGFNPLRIVDKGGMPFGHAATRALMPEASPRAVWFPHDTLWGAAPLVGIARSIPGMCAVDRNGGELTLDRLDGMLLGDERIVRRLVPLVRS